MPATSSLEFDTPLQGCSHRPPCPGCPRYGENGVDPSALHSLTSFMTNRGIDLPLPVVSGAATGFRHRARLAIRGRSGSPKVGLFELDTHRVVHIPHCHVHHPLINRVAAVVRDSLVATGLTCYSERAHAGLARYLQVVIERASQSAQVVVVGNSPDSGPFIPCFERIRGQLGSALHSLWFNANMTSSNVILGPAFENWHGAPCTIERFDGPAIHYPPGAFGQSNLPLAQRLIEHIRALIPVGSRVMEFYAGVGAIGLSLLPQLSALRLNEHSPHSLEGLRRGIAQLPESMAAHVSVLPGTAASVLPQMQESDVIIVDPPRKGLEAALLEYLQQQPPQRLLYVSCGLDAFLSDAAALIDHGGMALQKLQVFNLMPYTRHVELLACFDRARA